MQGPRLLLLAFDLLNLVQSSKCRLQEGMGLALQF